MNISSPSAKDHWTGDIQKIAGTDWIEKGKDEIYWMRRGEYRAPWHA